MKITKGDMAEKDKLPDKWDDESVKKIKRAIYKWKAMTEEMVKEFIPELQSGRHRQVSIDDIRVNRYWTMDRVTVETFTLIWKQFQGRPEFAEFYILPVVESEKGYELVLDHALLLSMRAAGINKVNVSVIDMNDEQMKKTLDTFEPVIEEPFD
jgi:hypothetical protein